MNRRVLVCCATFLVVFVSACDSAPAPLPTLKPVPMETPSRPTSAPPVPIGPNVTPFIRRACALLAADEVARFDLSGTPREKWSDQHGYCIYEGQVRLAMVVTADDDQLAWRYRESGIRPVWEELTVGGQPAVRYASNQPRVACHLTVGTAPGQAIDVDLTGETTDVDWCARTVEIAEAMLANLRK